MINELHLKSASASTWTEAYSEWGLSLEVGALSILMTPPSMKEDIRNESRLEDGVRHTDHNPKVAEREFSLPMHIVAKTKEDYIEKYESLLALLQSGWVDLKTSEQPDVVYHLKYRSCNPFRQFLNGMAVFSIAFTEPNPKNRT